MKRTIAMSVLILVLLAGFAYAQGRGEGKRKGPPPEAIDACENATAGDTCSFITPRGDREGMCVERRNGDGLICLPKDRRGKRKGPPEQAYTACENATAGDACSFTTPRGERNGQCVEDRRNADQLVCLPDKPGRRNQ